VSVIRQLIHLGMATQNIAQHSALQLTEAARPILRAEVPLQLAVPRVLALKPRVAQKSWGGNYDRKLFAKLRKLRKVIADEENIPPYVVFNDATLIEMAEQMPTSPGEMLSVNGVGVRKLERFGQEFLALIRSHVDGDDDE
jgi:ATP-dependent DNA helicase RecQ